MSIFSEHLDNIDSNGRWRGNESLNKWLGNPTSIKEKSRIDQVLNNNDIKEQFYSLSYLCSKYIDQPILLLNLANVYVKLLNLGDCLKIIDKVIDIVTDDNNLTFYTMVEIDRWRDSYNIAAWLHHSLITIHPFSDGNGRMIRFTSSIPLRNANLPPICIVKEYKTKYIEALEIAQQSIHIMTVYARSGRKWDYLYMDSLGLGFKDIISYKEFFEQDEPLNFNRQKNVDELLSHNLTEMNYNEDTSDIVVIFMKNINTVVNLNKSEESSVDDLGKTIFNLLGFTRNKDLYVHGPTKIKYLISGCDVEANPDIIIKTNNDIILLVQADKSYRVTEEDKYEEAEPQLVAEMLGAFYLNVQKSKGKLQKQTIYGIIMLGTYCTFYKFEITKSLISRISNGEICSEILNYIERFCIGDKDVRFMLNKENLIKTLKCYESLRNIIFSNMS
ncbi:hypothetical protein HK099_004818 [Clydaea vesicula]|uniref:Fido domain-containing protein n=1 Tax=Clydaea vesicula TaxID=447962 RepID=A0AAD5U4L8_9FUNG|nr:hypothetical protein HK099_004818 [Clydaea vesicula]